MTPGEIIFTRQLAQSDEAVVHRLAALAHRKLAGLVEAASGDDARKAGNRAGWLLERFAGNGSRLKLETLLDEVARDLTNRRQARDASADSTPRT
jgi:hypothetical protein